jgi:hypothetical protein
MQKTLKNPNIKIPKNPKKFNCEVCDYNTSNKKDFKKHESTLKHKTNCNPNNSYDKNPLVIFDCKCGNIYKHNSTLSAHKKKCCLFNETEHSDNFNEPETKPVHENIFLKEYDKIPSDLTTLTNLVLEVVKSNSELLKQNGEFQKQTNELQKQNLELNKQVLDVYQKIQPSTINNNSHNKTFNLQFFLNEQCKDAMNIMDFVNTFQLQFSDLERIGEVGYVEGISNIIIDKLNEMDVYKRPIHCSDAKREIMHIKDNDVWTKDTLNNDKLRLAIKHITKKNTDMIQPWTNAHPDVFNSSHRLNDKYQEIVIEAMGGNSGTIKECETKIIKKISKMVLIDKNVY